MWWTNETFQQFQIKTDCLIKQYDNITEPVTGKRVLVKYFYYTYVYAVD